MGGDSTAFVAALFSMPVAFVIDPFAVPLVFGLCLRANLIQDPVLLSPAFAGFESNDFIVIAAMLYGAHALADKMPPLAHMMDVLGVVLKPLAVAFIGFIVSSRIDPNSSLHWLSLAILLAGGAPATAGLQLIRTKTRFAVSAGSFGLALPLVSGLENFVGLGLSALIFTHPIVASILILIIGVPVIWLAWRLSRAIFRGGRRLAKRNRATLQTR